MSPLHASTGGGTLENCVEKGAESSLNTAKANARANEAKPNITAEDNLTEDSAKEDEDVTDNSIEDDAVVDTDVELTSDTKEDGNTAEEETSEEDSVLFQEIFALFIEDAEETTESTIEQWASSVFWQFLVNCINQDTDNFWSLTMPNTNSKQCTKSNINSSIKGQIHNLLVFGLL